MPLPVNVGQRTITGTYVDYQGNPVAGQVRFTLPTTLTDASANTFIVRSSETATLDANGSFSIQIPVTNDIDLSPYDYLYTVDELFPNGRSYTISLPAGAPIDISTIAPTATYTQFYSLANSVLWNLVSARVGVQETYWGSTGYLIRPAGYTGTMPINLSIMTGIQNTVKTHYTNVQAQQVIASAKLAEANSSYNDASKKVVHFMLMGLGKGVLANADIL